MPHEVNVDKLPTGDNKTDKVLSGRTTIFNEMSVMPVSIKELDIIIMIDGASDKNQI